MYDAQGLAVIGTFPDLSLYLSEKQKQSLETQPTFRLGVAI